MKKTLILILLILISALFAFGKSNIENIENHYFKKIDSYLKENYKERKYNLIINIIPKSEAVSYEKQNFSLNVAVQIEGYWEIEYDDKGKPIVLQGGVRKRKYFPAHKEELNNINKMIETIINNNQNNIISVENFVYDRSEQFRNEDFIWIKKRNTTYMLLAGLSGLLLLIIMTLIYRLVAINLERKFKKRMREIKNEPPHVITEDDEQIYNTIKSTLAYVQYPPLLQLMVSKDNFYDLVEKYNNNTVFEIKILFSGYRYILVLQPMTCEIQSKEELDIPNKVKAKIRFNMLYWRDSRK